MPKSYDLYLSLASSSLSFLTVLRCRKIKTTKATTTGTLDAISAALSRSWFNLHNGYNDDNFGGGGWLVAAIVGVIGTCGAGHEDARPFHYRGPTWEYSGCQGPPPEMVVVVGMGVVLMHVVHRVLQMLGCLRYGRKAMFDGRQKRRTACAGAMAKGANGVRMPKSSSRTGPPGQQRMTTVRTGRRDPWWRKGQITSKERLPRE